MAGQGKVYSRDPLLCKVYSPALASAGQGQTSAAGATIAAWMKRSE